MAGPITNNPEEASNFLRPRSTGTAFHGIKLSIMRISPATLLATSAVAFAAIALTACQNSEPTPVAGEGRQKGGARQRIEAAFVEMDKNKDGVIIRSEATGKAAQMFDKMDLDGNGGVTRAEVQTAAKQRMAQRRQNDASGSQSSTTSTASTSKPKPTTTQASSSSSTGGEILSERDVDYLSDQMDSGAPSPINTLPLVEDNSGYYSPPQ